MASPSSVITLAVDLSVLSPSATVTTSLSSYQIALGSPVISGPPGTIGPAGPGVPVGGAAGQALVKVSGNNFDTTWTTIQTNTAGGTSLTLRDDNGVNWSLSVTTTGALVTTGGTTGAIIDNSYGGTYGNTVYA